MDDTARKEGQQPWPFSPMVYPRGARGIKAPSISGTPLINEQDAALNTLKLIMQQEIRCMVRKSDLLREAADLLLIRYLRLPREEWRRGVPLPGEE